MTWNAEWPQALEAGWGLYMTLFVGVPFTVIAVRRRAFLQAAVARVSVAVGALIVSAIVATEWPLVFWALVIALETMIIAGLPSPRLFNLSARPAKLLMVPLVLGAISLDGLGHPGTAQLDDGPNKRLVNLSRVDPQRCA